MSVQDTGGGLTLRVAVDRDLCCGSGNCVTHAPEVFDQHGDGLVWLRSPIVPLASRQAVLDAVDMCPTGAIVVVD